ncbi:MAG TPA: response regulator [Candidatus Obscuribacterales bacterium]
MSVPTIQVLLIDGDEHDQAVTRQLLCSGDYGSFRVSAERSLETALAALRGGEFDVVLMDLALPDSDGIESFRTVAEQWPDTPVVVLSGAGNEKPGMQAVREGAQDFLVKGEADECAIARALLFAVMRTQADIDRRRREEQELADFFENAPIGIHWVGPDGRLLRVNQAQLELLGYLGREMLGRHIADFYADEDVIEDILRRLCRGETLNGYPARLRCKDGSIRYVLIDANVLFEHGQFIHTRWLNRDITKLKQAERASILQTCLVNAVAQFDNVKDVLESIIQTVCDTLNWEFGAFWVPEPDAQVMRCLVSWQQPGAPVEEFKLMSERIRLACGVGVPGHVWAEGKPVWIPDVVEDPSFPRAACARACGLHAALAVPVKAGAQVLGVIEFCNREILQPDRELLVTLSVVGSELGQLIQRKQAEETLEVTLAEFSESNRQLRRFADEFSGRLRHTLEPDTKSTTVSDAASGRRRSRKTRVATGEAGSLQNPD